MGDKAFFESKQDVPSGPPPGFREDERCIESAKQEIQRGGGHTETRALTENQPKFARRSFVFRSFAAAGVRQHIEAERRKDRKKTGTEHG